MQNKQDNESQPTLFIGIGASAGGLEAIDSFFSHMKPDSGFAFIVIQHLSPDYKSLMVELLSKKTQMQVFRAEDNQVVVPNTIYLIPPKMNLTIYNGKLLLKAQDPARGINLPIDVFFQSLAKDQGNKSVGIVLSGTGSDGTRGIRTIKEQGGMVMVQDENEAKFNGMPRAALSTGLADFVLPVEHMPSQLLSFASHPSISSQEKEIELIPVDGNYLSHIFSALKKRTNTDFSLYKSSTIKRRIERRMTVTQMFNMEDYIHYIEQYPGEIMALYRELLIGVTSFFRDKEVFKLLEKKYLPEVLGQSKKSTIRFWTAGCSTGEEAYSLAILTQECMKKLKVSHDVKIFATDIDKDAIQNAGNGLYPESIAADLYHPDVLTKYFIKRDDQFQIIRTIREMVVFAQHNLVNDPPFTNISLISCRNLLIYLQPILQRKALEMFNFSLNENGILVLGTSETVGDMSSCFKIAEQKEKIYRSTGRVVPRPQEIAGSIQKINYRYQKEQTYSSRMFENHRVHSEKLMDGVMEAVSDNYIPVSVVVNDQLEVVHSFGAVSRFFKMVPGKINYDITKMANRELAIPLATGIQKVFRTQETLSYGNIILNGKTTEEIVRVRIAPLKQTKGQDHLVIVFIEDVQTGKTQSKTKPGQTFDVSDEARIRIEDLEQDLQFTRENLQATIEELETSNEELQATNEELLASNEELQSTNEELQSTNEELHTVNTEYQNRIIELTELNNDVDNLLASSEIGHLLLDENLEVRKMSPHLVNIFNSKGSLIGKHVATLKHSFIDFHLEELSQKTQQLKQKIEIDVQSIDERWYQVRATPYFISPIEIAGVTITFIENTERKKAVSKLMKRDQTLSSISRLVHIGSWIQNFQEKTFEASDELNDILEFDINRLNDSRFLGKNLLDDYKLLFRNALDKALDEGKEFDLVLKMKSKKQKIKWIRIIASPLMINNEIVSLSGAIQDVSALKSIEKNLHDSEHKASQIIDHLPSGIYIYQQDNSGNFILESGNIESENQTGRKLEDIVGKSMKSIWPHAEKYGLISKCNHVMKTGKTLGFRNFYYKDDSQEDHYDLTIFKFQNNRLSIIFDSVSWKHKIEDDLAESESRFNTLFETYVKGIVYQDSNGNITAANPAAEKILGLSMDEMKGVTSMDSRWKTIDTDGKELPGNKHPSMIALRTGKPVIGFRMGVFNPVVEGIRWLRVDAVPEFKKNQKTPYQVYTIFEDVTEESNS